MHAYFEPFQRIDALLVSAITGTDRLGSLVQLADGSGYLLIAQGVLLVSQHLARYARLGYSQPVRGY